MHQKPTNKNSEQNDIANKNCYQSFIFVLTAKQRWNKTLF